MAEGSGGKYKWYVLVLCTLENMGSGAAWISMPALFPAIAKDLHLSLAQLGALWGMVPLAGLVFGLVGGLAADRLGVRSVVALGALLGGVASLLRGVADDFTMLAVGMFLLGISQRVGMPGRPKAIRSWFGSRQLGLAMGITASGTTFAGALALMFSGTVLSSALGGWRNVMFLFGGVLFLLGILWFLTMRDPKGGEVKAAVRSTTEADDEGTRRVSFREAFSHTIRIKDVWLAALAMTGIIMANQSIVFYTPTYLERIGMPEVRAHMIASATVWGIMLGQIVWPIISDKLGRRKAIFMLCALMDTVLAFSIPGLAPIAPLIIILSWGFFGGGAIGHSSVVMTEIRGVGSVFAGTATGISGVVSGIGGFLSPMIGGALAEANPTRGYIFWGAMPLISLLSFIFIKETGWRARESRGHR